MIRILLVAASLLLLVDPAHADTAPVRTIVGDVVYENGEFVFYDPIVIPTGSSLTLRNARVWFDAPYDCSTTCHPQLSVDGGTLRILGAVVDTHRVSGDFARDGYRIDSNAGVIVIDDSALTHHRDIRMIHRGPAPSTLTDTSFGVSYGPVQFLGDVAGAFERNTMRDVAGGVLVSDSVIPILDNRFSVVEGSFAIDVQQQSGLDRVWYNTAPIARNVVEDSYGGLRMWASFGQSVTDNVIRRVTTGASVAVVPSSNGLARQPASFHYNLFEDTQRAFVVSSSGPVNGATEMKTLDLTSNAFERTRCSELHLYPVTATMTLTVDMRGSWWGGAEGPQDHGPGCPSIRNEDESARVLTTPHLAFRPTWAP